MTRPASILIAACGNVAAGDDAFGPRVAQALGSLELPNTQVISLDMRPMALLDDLADRDALILVDAVACEGMPPGQVIEFDWLDPNRPPLVDDDILSTHGLSLADQLALAERIGMRPGIVRLIGLTVDRPAHGSAAGADLGSHVDEAVRRILEVVNTIPVEPLRPHHA